MENLIGIGLLFLVYLLFVKPEINRFRENHTNNKEIGRIIDYINKLKYDTNESQKIAFGQSYEGGVINNNGIYAYSYLYHLYKTKNNNYFIIKDFNKKIIPLVKEDAIFYFKKARTKLLNYEECFGICNNA